MNNFKIFLLLILLIPLNFAFAQSDDNYDPGTFMQNQSGKDADYKPVKEIKSKDFSKWSYNLNMGTSFTTGAYGSFLDVYTAPQLNYNFSPKWQFTTGLLIMNTSLFNSGNEKSINQTRAYLMNRISYQANEKLRISGEILYGMNQNPFNSTTTRKGEYYINVDAQYKINKSLSIGIRVSGTNMNNPYGYNPFYSGFSPATPLYRSPFDY